MPSTELWLVLLLVLGWLAIWLTVCWLIGLNWRRLAHQYAPVDDFEGEELRFRSGKLNWVGYGNCLMLTAGYRYLHLAILFPFRFGHPRISIPWSDIHIQEQTGRWRSCVALNFQQQPAITLRVLGRTGSDLIQLSGGKLNIKPQEER